MADPATTTERRAAKAARQLLYHRKRIPQIVERMAENEAILERYLMGAGTERGLLPGGYAVERTPEGISAERIVADHGYEQLRIEEVA